MGKSVATVSHHNASKDSIQPVFWQGIRSGDVLGVYLICGTSNTNGVLFVGTIEGVGEVYPVKYPGAHTTTIYGPDNLGHGQMRLVGSYKNADTSTSSVTVNGLLWEGITTELPTGGKFTTVNYPGAKYNYVSSTMGGLAVGNYDGLESSSSGNSMGARGCYVYEIASGTFTDITHEGILRISAYGIWQNGPTSFTICGGAALESTPVTIAAKHQRIGQAYLVDYNSVTKHFSNWKAFRNLPEAKGKKVLTHFEAISSVQKGIYTLYAEAVNSAATPGAVVQGCFVVKREPDSTFDNGRWIDLD